MATIKKFGSITADENGNIMITGFEISMENANGQKGEPFSEREMGAATLLMIIAKLSSTPYEASDNKIS